MSGKNELSLKEAIDRFIDQYNLKIKFEERKLTEAWQEIAGELIDKHTTDLYIKDKILYISVNSPVVKQELMFLKSRMKVVINRYFAKELIHEIKVL